MAVALGVDTGGTYTDSVLILIGFQARDLDAHGLRAAFKRDPVLVCSGGHDHAGVEAAPLDVDLIWRFLRDDAKDVSAFAVAAQFITRNPAHDLACVALIKKVTGGPVSPSHALSAKLNGPKRAITALLNARPVGDD